MMLKQEILEDIINRIVETARPGKSILLSSVNVFILLLLRLIVPNWVTDE